MFIDFQFTLQESQGQQHIRTYILLQPRYTYGLCSLATS